MPVELQFHTAESFDGKEEVHPHYEEYRHPETPKARKVRLWNAMVTKADKMTRPVGWEEIPGHKLQPPPEGYDPDRNPKDLAYIIPAKSTRRAGQ